MTQPTPAEAWKTLSDGNARFAAGTPERPHQDVERRKALADGQAPIAVVFACSDSRVAVELLFDTGLGDAFVVRNAGQVASPSAIGSLEYAVGPLGVPLLVVLGHESCGAVRAAIDSHAKDAEPLPPYIADLIGPISGAVQRVAVAEGLTTVDPAAIDALHVGEEHVRTTIADLLRDSEIIASATAEGRLGIVGATYRLADGTVQPHTTLGLSS